MIIRTIYKDIEVALADVGLVHRALELQLGDSSFTFLFTGDDFSYVRVAVIHLY